MNDQPAESHEFNVEITWTGGKEGTITPKGKPSLPLTSPLNWDGKPNAYSPHDLFLSAISGCYITTFASMMKRMKQPLQGHKVSGYGKLLRHPEGGWHFTDVYITMEITVPKEAKLPQVKRAINLTEKYCHITRSVVSKIHVDAKIHQLD
jgi:organic hydroperoxide reductase OsmC/OhrA